MKFCKKNKFHMIINPAQKRKHKISFRNGDALFRINRLNISNLVNNVDVNEKYLSDDTMQHLKRAFKIR